MPDRKASTGALVAAFAAVYLIWGSTYLAIRYAIEALPPFLMAGTRFLFAGIVLFLILRLRGVDAPRREHWPAAITIGGLLLLCGNGAVVWAQGRIPSGIAALLVAVEPLWIVLLDWIRPRGVRPAGRTFAGVILGFFGLVILMGPERIAGGGAVDLLGAAAVVFGAATWAAGSLYARDARLPSSPFMATAMEMMAGGVLLLAVSMATGEAARADPSSFTLRSVAALAYLAVFGSLVAFSAYIWLLGQVSASRVSTYAYVNPVVAVFLGWALANEPLTPRLAVAAAVIVGAVALITTVGERIDAATSAPEALGPAPFRARALRLMRRRA